MKHRMSRLLLAGIAFVFALESVAQAQVRLSDENIRQILRHRIVDEKKGVATVVGLIDESGTRVVGFGPPSHESDLTVDGNTLFEIGSITKVFTTILLADMVERGEVNLNDPIAKYLPASATAPTRNGKEITLLHLATHTSGLPRMPDNFAPLWWKLCFLCTDAGPRYADYSIEKMFAFLSGHKLRRDIESDNEYSNYGVALLGQILAARAEMDYETLVRARVTGPLDMHDTAIRLSLEKQTRLAKGHNASGKSVSNWDLSKAFAPAGGLRSTVNDMMKFIRANLDLTPSPLLTAMQKTQQPHYSTGNAAWMLGLGWYVLRGLDSDILEHGGGTGGYATYIAFHPKRRAGVAVLSNSVNDIEDIGLHLLDSLQYPLAKDTKARVAIPIDAATLDAYAGEYQAYQASKSTALGQGLELQLSYYFTVTREDTRLFVQPGTLRKVQVFPETETDFFWLPRDARETLLLPDAQASFVRESNGAVSHMVLHSHGNHWPAKKVR